MILKTKEITKELIDYEKIKKLAKEAFPPEEYLSPAKLIEIAKSPDFDFLALYDKEEFVGYIAVKRYETMSYLFFLAISLELRSKGYGRSAIETLKALYSNMQQVVDIEKLDEKSSNAKQREKRRNFYLKNGYKPTGHFISYYGVDYEILCMDENFDFDLFCEMMQRLTKHRFNPLN